MRYQIRFHSVGRALLVPLVVATLTFLGCTGKDAPKAPVLLVGPLVVDTAGVELTFSSPPLVLGTNNRILVSLPTNVKVDYSRLILTDSSNDTVVFTAEAALRDGKMISFAAHGVPGLPAEPGRTQDLQPDRPIDKNDLITRVKLRSNHRVVIPRVEWQSWSQGM